MKIQQVTTTAFEMIPHMPKHMIPFATLIFNRLLESQSSQQQQDGDNKTFTTNNYQNSTKLWLASLMLSETWLSDLPASVNIWSKIGLKSGLLDLESFQSQSTKWVNSLKMSALEKLDWQIYTGYAAYYEWVQRIDQIIMGAYIQQ